MTILIPLDGSYKEFQKYKQAFYNSSLWSEFVFIIDEDLNKDEFVDCNVIQLDISHIKADVDLCEDILRECNFDGNFDFFCIVEFYQNKSLYKDSKTHRDTCAKKLIYLSRVLDEINYECVIYNSAAHFFPRAIQLISKKLNKKVYSYTQSLIPGMEYIWVDDELFSSSALRDLIDNNQDGEVSKAIMKSVVDRKKNKTYMAVFGRSLSQEISSIYTIRSRLKISSINRRRVLSWFEKFLFRKLKAIIWKNSAIKKIPDDKFIYFPLHMPGESQTLIRGYPFINDVEVLYQLSMIVPSGIRIVTKEHPGYEGWKSLYELDLIKSMPNITLVDSVISSHDLIKKSQFIVTINSSAWFESMAFKKQVVTLGKGIFSGYGVTHEVDNFLKLKDIVKQLLLKEDELAIPQDRINKFIKFYSSISIKGEMYRYNASENKNFKNMINAKVREFKEA
jgi:hypothetical protein